MMPRELGDSILLPLERKARRLRLRIEADGNDPTVLESKTFSRSRLYEGSREYPLWRA